MWANIKMPFYCLFTGQFGRIWNEVHARPYHATWEARNYPQHECVDVGLVIYQFVRRNFLPRRSCCIA